jgi:hypothetical protein
MNHSTFDRPDDPPGYGQRRMNRLADDLEKLGRSDPIGRKLRAIKKRLPEIIENGNPEDMEALEQLAFACHEAAAQFGEWRKKLDERLAHRLGELKP